jgi:hypothetical protein
MNQSIEVTVERNPMQVTSCPSNFTVVEADGFDLGAVISTGRTEEEALKNFIESWCLKYDEEVSLTIKERIK